MLLREKVLGFLHKRDLFKHWKSGLLESQITSMSSLRASLSKILVHMKSFGTGIQQGHLQNQGAAFFTKLGATGLKMVLSGFTYPQIKQKTKQNNIVVTFQE